MAPKSKTPGCLERSISAFQAMYPNPDPPDDRDEVFRALRAHPGVGAEWEKIAPPRDDGLVDAIPIDVLRMILECKYFARENRDAPDDLARRRNDYRALRNAANLLHEHYEKMPIFSSPAKRQVMIRREAGTVAVEFDTRGMGDEIAERNIHEHNRQLLKAREALNWMKQDIERRETFAVRLNENIFSTSQKRNEEGAVFVTMMSDRLRPLLAKPCDSLVAYITDAIYNNGCNPESVRKARVRAGQRKKHRTILPEKSSEQSSHSPRKSRNLPP
jgi:hypothetical protein